MQDSAVYQSPLHTLEAAFGASDTWRNLVLHKATAAQRSPCIGGTGVTDVAAITSEQERPTGRVAPGWASLHDCHSPHVRTSHILRLLANSQRLLLENVNVQMHALV